MFFASWKYTQEKGRVTKHSCKVTWRRIFEDWKARVEQQRVASSVNYFEGDNM
jgi:hypothetical protein